MDRNQSSSIANRSDGVWRGLLVVLFAATALSKLVGSLRGGPVFLTDDPLLGISTRSFVTIAILIELCIAIAAICAKSELKLAWIVLGFASCSLVYQLLSHAKGITHCICLGNVMDWWPWLAQFDSAIVTSMACWFLLTAALRIAIIESRV